MQYLTMMKKIFTGDLISYANAAQRRSSRSGRACPRTFSLCIGAAIIWMSLRRSCFGYLSAVHGGQASPTAR